MQTYIVLPAYNEAKVIGAVIKKITAAGFSNVVVVDDGSKDKTAEVARQHQAIVISHPLNRGVGAATQTGLSLALKLGADIIVTIDADGQHHPSDLHAIIKPILNKEADLVIGSRFLKRQTIPLLRVIFNKIGNILTWAISGIRTTDSQSGFKAFSRKAAEKIEIHANGYEYCSEIFREIRTHKLLHKECPIGVTYSKESMQKGQHFGHGVEIGAKLIIRSLLK